MIGIKVNGRFLDIKPGTTAEIERKSPFFALEDYASEATTDTISIPYTANNALALDMPYQYYTDRKKIKIDAEQYDNNQFIGKVTLVLETGKLDLNNIENTEITIKVMYGISAFFQAIKGKKLKDLTLGGVRSFAFTTSDPTDGSNGYWQHFHETFTNAAIPYVFAPIRNEGYLGDSGPEWMNKLNGVAQLDFDANNPLVPLVNLKYLVEQIFAEHRYKLDTSDLNGTGWDKLVLVNLKSVKWTTIISFPGGPAPGHAPNVHIDLSEHMPHKKTISDFLIQLYFRYGWCFLFDQKTKSCRMVAVKNYKTGTKKDWTKYANPKPETDFSEDAKLFAFTNDIDSNDEYPSAPDFANIKLMAPLTGVPLPTPSANDEGRIAYVYQQNQFFQVQYNTTSLAFEWVYFADNIYNDEPEGNNETIATTISTLPVQYSEYRTSGSDTYAGYFPIMKQDSQKEIGYRVLFYHGLVPEERVGTGAHYYDYPYASSIRTGTFGIPYSDWSNVYHHQILNSTDYGIVPYWWLDFLPVLQAGEKLVMNFNMPMNELDNYQWDDIILVENIPFLLLSFVHQIPFNGFVQANMKRLTNKPYVVPVVVKDEDDNIVDVYAHLTLSNININTGAFFDYYYEDVSVNLYTDALGTIPFMPSTTFYILLKETLQRPGEADYSALTYIGMNSNYLQIYGQQQFKVTNSGGGLLYEVLYELEVSNSTEYAII